MSETILINRMADTINNLGEKLAEAKAENEQLRYVIELNTKRFVGLQTLQEELQKYKDLYESEAKYRVEVQDEVERYKEALQQIADIFEFDGKYGKLYSRESVIAHQALQKQEVSR